MAVTIPDTYDYGSVVPRVQPGVTSYRVGEAPVVSDAPGRALQQVGQDFKEVAADTEKWSLSLDSTMAQDALNKLRAARSDLTVGEDGFLKVRGGDVINKKDAAGNPIYTSYPQRLQSQYEELTANSNLTPRARRMLGTAAQNEINGFKADLARHGLSESEKYQAAVFVDTKSTLTDRAVQNVGDPAAFEQGLADIQTATRKRAAQLGVPSEALEKGAVSDVLKLTAMQMIAAGDSSAIGFFDRYKDRFDPKDSIAIEAAVKTMRVGVDARNWVAANTAAPTDAVMKKRVADGIDFWEKDGYGRHVGAGIIANFLHESGFRTDNPNPRDGADGSDSIGIAHWNSDRAEALKRFVAANGGNFHDVNTQLKFAKSEIDANPALKAKLMAAKTAAEAAEIFTREFERPRDPHLRAAERARTANKILAENPTGAAEGGLAAADAALKLTPQEKALYQRHLTNLNGAGGVDNADGTRSTLFATTVTIDDRTYVLPTVYDGKKVSPEEAIQRAKAEGLDKFPSYGSVEEAQARYDKLHGFMEKDTQARQQAAGGTGDPALDAVNAATGTAPARPQSPNADGIVDARRMMLDVEQRRIALTQKAQAELAGNLPQLQATLHQIEAQYQQQKAGVQLYKDNLYANVQDWMSKSGPNGGPAITVPPANIFSQLTWEQQQSIERQVERNIAGKKTVTDQNRWYNIHQGLTSNDPAVRELWANAPLFQFKEFLSDQDFQELAKLQAAARKGDPDKELSHVRSVNELVNDTLNKMGIDPTPKPGRGDATKAADFRRAVQDSLTAFEKEKGKKATPEEAQKIIDQQTREVAGTGGWFSKDKRVFQMKIGDVPAPEQAKIRDALTRAGQPVTDQAIIDLYARKNGKAQ